MNATLSRKIRYVSFLSMIAVVFLHAYNYTDTFLQSTTKITEGLNPFAMFEFFISNGITRFAVPVFFMISAFFLFRKLDNNLKAYGTELKKRCRTVLLPWGIILTFWTLVGVALCFITATKDLALIKEKCQVIFENKAIVDKVYSLIFNPVSIQLWYLWTLFVLVLISPLFYLFVKQLKGFPIIILFGLWLFNIECFVSMEAIFFFALGAFIAVNIQKFSKYLYNYKSKGLSVLIFVIFILLTAAYTYLAADKRIEVIDPVRNIIFKVMQLLSVVAIWRICDGFGNLSDNNILVKLSPSSFVIFAFHEPIQHLIFQSLLNNSSSNLLHILIFVFVPIILIIVLYFFDKLLRKAPKLHSLITGGR